MPVEARKERGEPTAHSKSWVTEADVILTCDEIFRVSPTGRERKKKEKEKRGKRGVVG